MFAKTKTSEICKAFVQKGLQFEIGREMSPWRRSEILEPRVLRPMAPHAKLLSLRK